jgi:putative glutamine amidotransferase
MQVANVALGGTLYKNISAEYSDAFNHDPKKTKRSNFTHVVELKNNSILRKIFKKNVIRTNGGHAQAVKKLSKKFIATAIASDGIVEAYERRDKYFFMGIQFHAELRLDDLSFFAIFKTFIHECSKGGK